MFYKGGNRAWLGGFEIAEVVKQPHGMTFLNS